MSNVKYPKDASICSGEPQTIESMGGSMECWKPNGDPYPLCLGNGSDLCPNCCLYQDMIENPER